MKSSKTKASAAPADDYQAYIDGLRARVVAMGRTQVTKALQDAFSNTPKEHPLLKAIHMALVSQVRVEHLAARNASLSDAQMRQQLGRECALEDFLHLLLTFHDRVITDPKLVS